MAGELNVFKSFPDAIEDGWSIGRAKRGTDHGTVIERYGEIHPIVSDGVSGNLYAAVNAATVDCDLLLYARPEELPATNVNVLLKYGVIDPNGDYYDIIGASLGKNQQDGHIEHIELMLQRAEAEVING